jgi:F420-non-reducing hydrogenase large subunit
VKKTIAIDPVTRIEGHAKVFLDVAADGSLESARLVVNELRGFERILVGMQAERMPSITARICGVCPSAHHLAASKALDAAAGVEPPPAAKLLRELLYMGHFIHSHALSLFVLQGPDLVMGLDADPATRNVVSMVQAAPEMAKKALRCRTLGQKINEMVGGRGIHPVTSVAGGITFQVDNEKRRTLQAWADELVGLVSGLAAQAKTLLARQMDAQPELRESWTVPVWSMGTVQEGRLDFYEGKLRAIDAAGAVRLEYAPQDYDKHLTESAVDWSYMKPVHMRDGGGEAVYRVGPLARINVAERIGTPLAEAERKAFRAAAGWPAHQTVLQAHARIIELLYAAERAQEIVREGALGGETRVPVRFTGSRGVGHVEAPRGSLFHDYEIDEKGIVRSANLLVATQQNYAAINRSIEQAAQSHVLDRASEGLLNAVEFAIRCYDPCLSCATHAMGRMPLEIEVRHGGSVIRSLGRRTDA